MQEAAEYYKNSVREQMTREELRAKEKLRETIRGECIKNEEGNGNSDGCDEECDNDCFFYASRLEGKVLHLNAVIDADDKKIKELEGKLKTAENELSSLKGYRDEEHY